jgi:hypothetical protein
VSTPFSSVRVRMLTSSSGSRFSFSMGYLQKSDSDRIITDISRKCKGRYSKLLKHLPVCILAKNSLL